ncbi:MAG: flagellar biosynthetic protein FliO [candidate division Zixibacteria bacterium]|nr:flagellar biosynthetic protein FliO [candidate division Zixibacteria bacterium]
MKRKTKRTLIALFVILVVSSALMLTLFGDVKAGRTSDSRSAETLFSQDAGETAAEGVTGMADGDSITMSLVKLILALVVVVVAIYGFLYVLRRMMGPKFAGNRNGSMIEVLETVYVAQKRSISLVRFHDRAVLVGIGDNGVQPLAEMSAEETAKAIAAHADAKPAAGFRNVLSDARDKLKTWNMVGGNRHNDVRGKREKPQTA